MSFELEKNIVEKSKDIEAEKKELLRQSTAYINAGGRGTRLEPILSKDEKIGIT